MGRIKLNHNKKLKPLKRSKSIEMELDRKDFHLKTLYDVSCDIFSTVDSKNIVKNFLLMTMGNFGIIQGFIFILDMISSDFVHFESKGFHDNDLGSLRNSTRNFLISKDLKGSANHGVKFRNPSFLPSEIACALTFALGSHCYGLLALGSKLSGGTYTKEDKELLRTLLNNLIIALKNAKSFEDIKYLNKALLEKNTQLENTLNELQTALRKIEILERIKGNLCRFVPNTVTSLIEKSPTGSLPESKEQDVSVLFIDIQGYSTLSERLNCTELNRVVETYFSVFMDAIYENNGDVNETAGDGLMILFLSQDEENNAFEAVRTAIRIREKTTYINKTSNNFSEPLIINMGISSGHAFLGIVKFESLTGSRYTYTARGTVTNVAARIGKFASNGAILLSKSTADRVKNHFPLITLGKFRLKNISEEIEVFAV